MRLPEMKAIAPVLRRARGDGGGEIAPPGPLDGHVSPAGTARHRGEYVL